MVVRMERFTVTAWLGAPPNLKLDGERVGSVIDDALRLYGNKSEIEIRSSEPCRYRLTPTGRESLSRAITRGAVRSLLYYGEYPASYASGENRFSIRFDDLPDPYQASTFSVVITDKDTVSTAAAVSETIKRWFVCLDAACAWVSYRRGDDIDDSSSTAWTKLEATRRQRLSSYWPALQTFVRGAFWGNLLSASHCDRLGGRDRILREAPVWHAQPVGEGIWLQLSKTLPPSPDAVDRLEAYLAPLLNWTPTDVEQWRLAWATKNSEYYNSKQFHSPPETRSIAYSDLPEVRWLFEPEDAWDLDINIYVDEALGEEARQQIGAIIQGWFAEGAQAEGFESDVPYHLREMTEPAFGEMAVRFSVECRSEGKFPLIVERLREWLTMVTTVRITEVILGMETVG
jgi:hypothetical protein